MNRLVETIKSISKGTYTVKYPFLICVLISLLELIVISTNFYTKFNTNDDVMMMLISKGLLFSNEPSHLILYSNFIYGKYLVFFSSLFKGINFYTYNNIILIFTSLTFIRYSLILFNKELKVFLFVSFVFFPISLYLYTNLQFTILASLLFISGIVSLYTSYKLEVRLLFLFGIVAIIFSGLIRYEQTIILCAFIFPFLLFLVLKLKVKKYKFFITFSILMVVGGAVFFLNPRYYRNVEHYNFHDANVKILTLFYDYKVLDKVSGTDRINMLNMFNLTESDVTLFKMYYVTPELIDKTKNFELNNFLKNATSNIKFNLNAKLIKNEFSQFCIKYLLIIFCCMLLLYYGNWKNNLILVLVFLLSVLYFIFLSQTISMYLKAMQFRVLFSVSVSLLFVLFLYYFSSERKDSKNIFVIAFALLAVFYNLKFIANFDMRKNTTEIKDHQRFKNFFLRLNPSKTYVWNQSVPILNRCDPFDNLDWMTQKIFPMGMLSEHPAVKKCFPEIALDFDRAVLNNEKVRLILRKESIDLLTRVVKSYYLNNYNIVVNISQDKELSYSLNRECYFFTREN